MYIIADQIFVNKKPFSAAFFSSQLNTWQQKYRKNGRQQKKRYNKVAF
jgi:hypothetical protein